MIMQTGNIGVLKICIQGAQIELVKYFSYFVSFLCYSHGFIVKLRSQKN